MEFVFDLQGDRSRGWTRKLIDLVQQVDDGICWVDGWMNVPDILDFAKRRNDQCLLCSLNGDGRCDSC